VEWLPLFAVQEFATCIVKSLKHCVANKGLMIYGYCIMPTHIHLIVQSHTNPLVSVIRDFKKFTYAKIANIAKSNEHYLNYMNEFKKAAVGIKLNKLVKVWQDGYHPEIIFSNTFFFQKLNYIHNNPVVAGIVSSPIDYYYSSARNYAGLDAPLKIIFESRQVISYKYKLCRHVSENKTRANGAIAALVYYFFVLMGWN